MKRSKSKNKTLSLHVYAILDKKFRRVTKVSLDKEEIEFEIDLDNHDQNLILCNFEIRIKIPI